MEVIEKEKRREEKGGEVRTKETRIKRVERVKEERREQRRIRD